MSITITNRAFRPAEFRAGSLDAEARTVEVIWSSGASVKRWSWDEGAYWEQLSMSAESVDLARLNAGASFLDTHAQTSMADRLGAVVPGSARIEGGKGLATIILSSSKSGEQILTDLRAGLPLLISVGYRVSAYEKSEGEGDSLPIFTATRWEPLELSAVPIPADAGAMARAETQDTRSRQSVPVTRRAEGAAAKVENIDMTTSIAADPAETLERSRADEILSIGERHNVPSRVIRKAVKDGNSIAEFRLMAMEAIRKEQEKTQIFGIAPSDGERSDVSFSDIMSQAIQARVDRTYKPSDAARGLIGLSIPELARRAIEARGEGTRGCSAGELVTRALHTGSDFPIALGNVANRLVRKGYEATPSAVQQVARQATARDFKPRASIFLATKGGLEKVNEHGEFKRGTFSEGAELYAIETYGKIFGLTRQALINDDLSLFDRLPQELGQKAKNFEADFLAKLVEGTRKMSDGAAVFHATHGNLGSGATLSVAALAAGRLAMRKQRNPDGDLAGMIPRFLVVPSDLELTAEQVLAVINAEKPSDVNPFSGKLELLVEPRLADTQAWYLAAGRDQSGLEFAYLEGAEGPQIDTRAGFDIDGTEWKVRLDFGGGWQDFRGFWKNPGVTP
ncbi:MAG: hypothetical protein JWP26_45 [Devosia sp.]|uniref:prohead protease/major capsid protein fusion protein n=1 Tax=Devosia sp. TaxID=1871048 RepID=UPI00262461EB|nr:prohead protease/major capsid protein fusion protein [Devosia sp.]MDB5585075.1 hypothetical protein [Devosia sp.]